MESFQNYTHENKLKISSQFPNNDLIFTLTDQCEHVWEINWSNLNLEILLYTLGLVRITNVFYFIGINQSNIDLLKSILSIISFTFQNVSSKSSVNKIILYPEWPGNRNLQDFGIEKVHEFKEIISEFKMNKDFELVLKHFKILHSYEYPQLLSICKLCNTRFTKCSFIQNHCHVEKYALCDYKVCFVDWKVLFENNFLPKNKIQTELLLLFLNSHRLTNITFATL